MIIAEVHGRSVRTVHQSRADSTSSGELWHFFFDLFVFKSDYFSILKLNFAQGTWTVKYHQIQQYNNSYLHKQIVQLLHLKNFVNLKIHR